MKPVTVWVQRFKDRRMLVLQWFDPDTGKRKSRSAQTANKRLAEKARAALERELNGRRPTLARRKKRRKAPETHREASAKQAVETAVDRLLAGKIPDCEPPQWLLEELPNLIEVRS